MGGNLGERIKRARLLRGWTQTDLAERVDLRTETICRYERGDREPQASDLERIAQALDVSVSYLLGEDRGLNEWARLLRDVPAIRGVVRQMAQLSEEEQQAVLRICEEPLVRSRLGELIKLLGPGAGK